MPNISASEESVLNLIGNTPSFLFDSNNSEVSGKIIAKLEKYNPFGSVKDRIALEMIEEAEKEGKLKKGDTLLEVSSGNTGIALASIALIKGYNMKVILPETASKERIQILKMLNAEIIFVKPEDWRDKAVRYGKELALKNGWIMLNQYENEANVTAHYKTGKEIIKTLESKKIVPDYFVAGIGTGGTITGIARVLKSRYPKIKIIGILPEGKIEGLRGFEEFKPKILDLSIVDKLVRVGEADAKNSVKDLISKHSLLIGMSSGAAYLIAKKYASRGGNVVTLFPDGIDKYLSYI